MAKKTLELTGDKALDAALSEFPKKFVNKPLKAELKAAVKDVVVRDAQRLAPSRTGMLRRSIRVRTAKGRGNKRLPRGIVGFAAVSVKTKTIDAFYSGWVFLGATNRDGTKRRGSRTLRKALYDNATVLRARVTGGLKKALPQIAREVAAATKGRG